MGRRLASAVAVHTAAGTVWLSAGQSPSPDLAVLIVNADCWDDREETNDVGSVTVGKVVPSEPPRAGRGSSRKAWAAYAESVGVEVEADWDRDAIIAAVESVR